VNEFIEECRREWRRLLVPEPIANEMAADLEADLTEAEAEGATPEDVLGSGAFDPRSFAALWAAERGVSQPPPTPAPNEVLPVPQRGRRWRPGLLAIAAGSGVIAFFGAALVVHHVRSSRAIAAPFGPRLPIPPRLLIPPPFARSRVFPLSVHVAAAVPTLGLLLILLGIIGVALTILYSNAAAGRGRWSRRRLYQDQTSGGRYP